MNSRYMNSPLISFVALLSLASSGVGCGAAPSSSPSGEDTTSLNEAKAGEEVEVVGEAIGHFSNGHIEFTAIEDASGPGSSAQNFGSKWTQSKIAFATPSDGVGTGTCTSTQYCANTSVKNNTGVPMKNVFVEVTDFFGVIPSPTAGPITLVNPVTVSTAYKSAFKNAANPIAASYGTIATGGTNTVEWKWNYGTATDFSFHVKVLASFNRPTLSGSIYQGPPTAQLVDACAVSGRSIFFQGGDDAETQILLPFVVNFFDVPYDRMTLSSNGYVLPYNTGDAVPTRDRNNVSMVTAGLPNGIYVFWDDLAYDGVDGVCVATTGVTPNRFLNITWKNAKINSVPGQATKGTWTTEKTTFSLRVEETTDRMVLAWALPTGGITAQTRSSTAHIGFNQNTPGTTKYQYNVAKDAVWLPSGAAGYPTNFVALFLPQNP